MKVGDLVYTPRFCTVRISEMFSSKEEAFRHGYKEPTYYVSSDFGILGKSLDLYHMEFCGYKRTPLS